MLLSLLLVLATPANALLVTVERADALADALALWDAGRRVDAVAALAEHVAEAAPEPGDQGELARGTLARWELRIHRYGAALEHARGLDSSYDALRGTALYRLGRFDEALPFLDATHRDLCLVRIDALEALGRIAASERELVGARALRGADDPAIAALEGRSLARAGQHGAAAAAFRRALAADPLQQEALFGLGRALLRSGARAEGLRQLELHRQLVPLLDQLEFAERGLDLAPHHAPNHAQLGDVQRELFRATGDVRLRARAADSYRRAEALAEAPEHAPIALRLARLLAEDAGDLAAALAALERAAAVAPDVRLHVRAGDLLLAAGERERALEQFRAAQALRPGDAAIRARIEAARR